MGQMFAIYPSPLRICKNTSDSWEHKALITLLIVREQRDPMQNREVITVEKIF